MTEQIPKYLVERKAENKREQDELEMRQTKANERQRKIKEIEEMKYTMNNIVNTINLSSLYAYAQAMIAFNRLCNEEVDRL